jgi:hypothetical protein
VQFLFTDDDKSSSIMLAVTVIAAVLGCVRLEIVLFLTMKFYYLLCCDLVSLLLMESDKCFVMR